MLTNRPQIGEVIEFRFDNIIEEYTIGDMDDKMIYVTNNRTGKKEYFIWKHIDGSFNTLLYNKEDK